MTKISLLMGVAGLACAALAQAETTGTPPASTATAATTPVETQGKAPQLSDLPIMKAESERIAALMERLSKETDLAERRKIMAELTCAQ